MKILSKIPFLALAVLAFHLTLWTNHDAFDPRSVPLFSMELPSGAWWHATSASFVMMLGTVLLVFDVIRSQRIQKASGLDLLPPLALFGLMLAEFLFWEPAGNATGMALIFMLLAQAAAVFLAPPPRARRDFGVSGIH